MKNYYRLSQWILSLLLVSTSYADFYDPTQPPSASHKKEANDDLNNAKVNLILYSKESRICVINGERYKEGDTFGQFIIKRISADSVDLDRAGEEVTLYLAKGF